MAKFGTSLPSAEHTDRDTLCQVLQGTVRTAAQGGARYWYVNGGAGDIPRSTSRLGFSEKGSLWVAQTSDRLHTLKRQYATTKALGINCEILNVEKLVEKVPIIDPHEIWVGEAWRQINDGTLVVGRSLATE